MEVLRVQKWGNSQGIRLPKKILKDLDYKEIELTVAPENEIAINLYKKHGYAQEKLLEDEYGKGIHRYVMRKKLF